MSEYKFSPATKKGISSPAKNAPGQLSDARQNLPRTKLNDKRAIKDITSLVNSENSYREPVQLYMIPNGLTKLNENLTSVSNDIHETGPTNVELSGSVDWANSTYHAANRKLNEWYLVKHLASDSDTKDHALKIGFGTDETEEADVVAIDDGGSTLVAGENKLVNGKFPQISENINSAFSQLTEGNRAKGYGGAQLLARIDIQKGCDAYNYYNGWDQKKKKAQTTRWRTRLNNAFEEGSSNWKGPCTLILLIECKEDQVAYFNEKMEPEASTLDEE